MNAPSIPRKRIVIDARCVVANQGHGIARHTAELLEQVFRLPAPEFEFVLLVNPGSPYLSSALPPHVTTKVMRFGWISPPGQFELAWVLHKLNPALYHTPSFVVPLLSSTSFVATIHDLIHIKRHHEYTLFHQLYYKFFLKWKIARARAVITVSEFSKQEIVQFYQVNPEKVHVIYNGISDWFRRPTHLTPDVTTAFRERYELPETYILSVGNKKSHKNILRLVEAWCQADLEEPLVLLTEFDPQILRIAGQYNKRHRIYFARYIPDRELPTLYSLAKAFVYPSLYEGFGLPPLEAAACGVPVVVSNRSSLPEVMRDAAIFVNPEDTADIIRGMREALGEPREHVLENVRRGLQLVDSYSWERMGQDTLALYRGVTAQ